MTKKPPYMPKVPPYMPKVPPYMPKVPPYMPKVPPYMPKVPLYMPKGAICLCDSRLCFLCFSSYTGLCPPPLHGGDQCKLGLHMCSLLASGHPCVVHATLTASGSMVQLSTSQHCYQCLFSIKYFLKVESLMAAGYAMGPGCLYQVSTTHSLLMFSAVLFNSPNLLMIGAPPSTFSTIHNFGEPQKPGNHFITLSETSPLAVSLLKMKSCRSVHSVGLTGGEIQHSTVFSLRPDNDKWPCPGRVLI